MTQPKARLADALVECFHTGVGGPDLEAASKLRELGYEWNGKAWAAIPCTYKCEAWPECACAAQPEPEPRRRASAEGKELMSKYTPGPWLLFEVGGDNGTVEKLCPVSSERQSILTVTEEQDSIFAAVLSDADARLIAAAPELLEALKEVYDWCYPTDSAWANKARAAIAKAEMK